MTNRVQPLRESCMPEKVQDRQLRGIVWQFIVAFPVPAYGLGARCQPLGYCEWCVRYRARNEINYAGWKVCMTF